MTKREKAERGKQDEIDRPDYDCKEGGTIVCVGVNSSQAAKQYCTNHFLKKNKKRKKKVHKHKDIVSAHLTRRRSEGQRRGLGQKGRRRERKKKRKDGESHCSRANGHSQWMSLLQARESKRQSFRVPVALSIIKPLAAKALHQSDRRDETALVQERCTVPQKARQGNTRPATKSRRRARRKLTLNPFLLLVLILLRGKAEARTEQESRICILNTYKNANPWKN